MKVMVVEDEVKMASLLLRGFRKNGDAVDVAPAPARPRSGWPALLTMTRSCST